MVALFVIRVMGRVNCQNGSLSVGCPFYDRGNATGHYITQCVRYGSVGMMGLLLIQIIISVLSIKAPPLPTLKARHNNRKRPRERK